VPQVLQPTKYIKQAQLKKIQTKTAARQNVDQEPNRMIPSLLPNELELLTVMLAVRLSWFHTEYTPIVTTQLDTGATCSAMSYVDLLNILQSGEVKLGPPGGKIRLCDGRVVEPLGSYTFIVSLNHGPKCKVPFDILESAPWPIIDGNTCIKQGWISLGSDKHIHSSTCKQYEPLSCDKLMRDYDDVFTGLGCLPGEYHIEVDPDIKPVQYAPRRVPVPLKARLKEKIAEMEKHGIIVRETEPTDWISSLVAVQKPGKLRVCIDPRDLNRAIKRPKYQMPTVEEVLPKLAKAKVFTVLDAKGGFHQVKLDKESSLLTTFWTPFGRYRYLRMPQGISSAPEEYQRRQNEALSGLNGVEVIADDILCYGSGETIKDALADHDSNLVSLLDRARKVNLKLNKKKLRLHGIFVYVRRTQTRPLKGGRNCQHATTTRQKSCSAPSGMCNLPFQIHANPF